MHATSFASTLYLQLPCLLFFGKNTRTGPYEFGNHLSFVSLGYETRGKAGSQTPHELINIVCLECVLNMT